MEKGSDPNGSLPFLVNFLSVCLDEVFDELCSLSAERAPSHHPCIVLSQFSTFALLVRTS